MFVVSNPVAAENFAARLKQANIATKADFDDFVENTDFDNKLKDLNENLTSNKTKHVGAKQKLTDLTNKIVQKQQKKRFGFLLDRRILQVKIVIRNF